MARSRDIEYRVGFSGDVSQLEAAVKKATDSLNKLGTSPETLRTGLEGASRAALELSNHLSSAFNQSTGKLDLVKFRQQIDASGKSIGDYAKSLSSLGPQGQQAFLDMATAIGKAELPLRRTNNIVKQFGVTLWNTARWRITTSAINAFVGGLQQAVGYSKSLDASLNNIRIVTNKSAADMAAFAKQANAAAKTLSTTTTAYTDASLIYYQQGLSDEQVAARTEATIKMANVTGQAAEEISSQMTSIWNNFEEGARTLESYGDAIVALGATTAASSEEIATGLQKFAPIAQTVGLSFDYASAALTTIVQNTRESATAAGTSLKTLFSRLEGLKLGETLDDGTDLNKYSNALMAVGVNIKNTNGELKDMDTILNDLGAKWQTLARDQQMALAETVGGVRQYAQLVALMDNWSDFQRNLVTVQGSQGELQKQADIYAESWEAARNRIKAATEDIYDSLINPQQFIKLDNIFTPILTGIASAVDAIGGLTGLLPIAILLMNQAFGDKISQSMRDMATNIGLMTGAEQKRARALQETVDQQAQALSIREDDNSVVSTKLALLKDDVKLQGEINTYIDQMTASQKDALNLEMSIVNAYKEEALAAAEVYENRKKAVEEAKIDFASSSNINPLTSPADLSNLIGNRFITDFFTQNIKGLTSAIDTDAFNTGLNDTIKLMEKVVTEGTQMATLETEFKKLGKITEENADYARQLLDEYNKLTGSSISFNNLEKSLNQIKSNLHDGSKEAMAVRRALEEIFKDLNYKPSAIEGLTKALIEAANAATGATRQLNTTSGAMERLDVSAIASSRSLVDWADKIVKVGSALSSAAIAIRSVQSLADTFDENSQLSNSEKWIQRLVSLGMILRTLNFKSMFTDFSKAFSSISKIIELQQTVSSANALVDTTKKTLQAATKGTKAYAEALVSYQDATNMAAVAQGNLNKALIISKAAAGIAVAAITAIIVAIALYIRHQQKLAEQRKQENDAAQESINKAKEEAQAIHELVNSYQDLVDSTDDTLESKQAIADKALEVARALGIEGAALANLTGDYTEFNENIRQASKDRAEQTALDAANNIATINKNLEAQNPIFKNRSLVSITKVRNTAGSSTEAERAFAQFLEQNAQGLVFQNPNASTIEYEVNASTIERRLQLIQALQRFVDENNFKTNDELNGIEEQVKRTEAQINELKTSISEYSDAYNTYLVAKKTAESYVIEPDYYTDFKTWRTETIADFEAVGKSASEAESLISQVINNLGYEEWERIYELEQDVLNTLKDFPTIVKFIEEQLSGDKKITPKDVETIAQMSWGMVDRDEKGNIDETSYQKEFQRTQERINLQQEGAQAALDYANAEKFLQQVQSKSGIKVKDVEGFNKYFDSTEEFTEFLSTAGEEQTRWANDIIDKFYDAEIQKNKDRRDQLEQDIKDYNTQIENLTTKYEISTEEQAEYRENKSRKDTAENILTNWFNQKGDYLRLGADKYNEKQQSVLSQLTTAFEGSGIDSEDIADLLNGTSEVSAAKLDNLFKDKLNETTGQVVELTDKVEDLNNELETTNNTIEIMPALKLGQEIEIAESAKNLGELNTQYRLRNIHQEAYQKGIISLAKKIPQATKALKQYNEAITDEDKEKAYQELKEIVETDIYGQVATKIKEATEKISASGMNFGELPTGTQNVKLYTEQLGKIAEAIREATGASEELVNASWVQTHAEQIKAILDGDATAIQSLNNSINLAIDSTTDNFRAFVESIGIDSNKISNYVTALDGINFDINGYADMNQVISNLLAAGATATQVAQILKYISDADVGFTLEGLGRYTSLMDAAKEIEAIDPAAANLTKLQAVQALKLKGTKTIDIPPYVGGGGGGGGSSKDQSKDLEDTSNRYHEINRELERQDRILSEIQKRIDRTYGTDKLKAYQDEQDAITKKIEQQRQKYDEAARHLGEDRAKLFTLDENGLPTGFAETLNKYGELTFPDLTSYGEFVGYDESGNALYSYQKLRQEIVEKYNAAVEGLKDNAEDKEALDKWFEHITNYLDNYENSLDTYNTIIHDIKESERQLEDSKLNEIKYKVEVAIDIRDARKQMREFSKSIEESFGDMVTHGIKAAKAIQTETEGNISDEIAMFQTYATEYAELQERLANATDATDINAIVDELKNLESNIISSGEALLEWLETVENMYADTLSDAADRFEAFTNQIAHDTDVIGMIKELYALQGVTYKTQQNFNKLQQASLGEYTGYMRQAQLNKTWYDNASRELAKYEEEIRKLEAEVGAANLESDVRYDALKKSRDALLEESNKAQKAMLENAQSAMETARQMYLDEIDKLAYDVEQRLSRGLGFDLLQDKYDHFIEKSERYLDPIEEGLEAATWYSKLDADIQQTTNKAYQERLKALKNEVDTRRELNTLSQYDLDIIEARYQVLQAEMALEDAKNNKNTLRLVRDSQGNWNYQYTANPDDVAAKEQELLGARKNEYEITKNRYKELNDELLKMTQEWAEKDKKIRQDVANGILTEAEGQKRLDELQNFYTQKAEYLKTELDIAVEDMQTAATTSADLVSSLSENAYDTTDNMMRDLKNSFTSYLDEMSGYLIQNFEPAVVEYVGHAEAAFTTFKGQIQETANAIGVNPDSLDAMVSTLTSNMNSLYNEADQATRALWNQLQQVRELQIGYQQLMVDVMNAVRAMEQLNGKVVGSIETARGTLDSNDDNQLLPYVGDLSQQMAAALYNSYINKDELNKFSQLAQQRQEAIAGMTGVMTNDELMIKLDDADRELLKAYATGQAYIQVDSDLDTDKWKEIYDKTGAPTVMIASGATGMYTGEFEGGKLGILHQKELVLNAEDTKNMLAAVEVVRGLQDSVFATIGKALDGNAAAAYAMLGSRFNTAMSLAPAQTELEQHVTIEQVNFPNVTSSREIEEAFENLVNDAAQWARRRKS